MMVRTVDKYTRSGNEILLLHMLYLVPGVHLTNVFSITIQNRNFVLLLSLSYLSDR